MKAILLIVAVEAASRIAFVQGTADPMADLRACSLMEQAERLEYLEKLSRSIAPPVAPAPGGDSWIVSETTSPPDHHSHCVFHRWLRLFSIHLSVTCRGGRTELVVAGPAVSRSSGGTPYRTPGFLLGGPHVRFRRVQTLVQEGSPLVTNTRPITWPAPA
jgi:hypothetical protein